MSDSLTPAVDFGAGTPDIVQVEGEWRQGEGFLEHVGAGSGSITVDNVAARVDITMSSATGSSITVGVREDGPPLDRDWCGEDCEEHPEHGAATTVTEHRAYWITRRDENELHQLTLEVEGPGLRVHRIDFSARPD